MAISFPSSPSTDDVYLYNGVKYIYDGTKWVSGGQSFNDANYAQTSGDTFTGNVAINADLTVDTNTLYVDSANNRVGIGTTNPTETLTVDGNIEFESNTQSIKFAAGNSAVNSIEVNSGSGPRASIEFLGVGTSQTTDIVFKTPDTSSTSAERMRIKTTTGNVGIGTNSPGEPLEVVASSSVIKSRSTGNFTGKLVLESDRAASAIGGQVIGNWDGNQVSRIDFINGADGTNKDDGEISFLTSSSGSNVGERMRITNAGNVGIGTTNPESTLHLRADGDELKSLFNLQNRSTGSNAGSQIAFFNGGVDASDNRLAYIRSFKSGSNGNFLTFGTNADGTAPAERMRIDASGNIGIGTNSPASLLHIDTGAGNFRVSSFGASSINIQNSVASGVIRHIAGGGHRFSTSASTEIVRITGGGSVGIGTTTPAVKLDVNGEIRASTGVLFGTDTAAVNTLDDYEEGTWTPGIQGATTAGSYTFTSTGAYTKVGNKVTVWGELTNITTVSAGSGITRITGLPFTNSVGFDAIGSILLDQWDLTSTAIRGLTAQVIDNVNYMQPRLTRDGATDTGLQITDKTNNNADIRFCITYTVA